MKTKEVIWFCRDDDGNVSIWDGTKSKPVKAENGVWSIPLTENFTVIADTTTEAFDLYGKGFHGVKKGGCRKFEVTKEILFKTAG